MLGLWPRVVAHRCQVMYETNLQFSRDLRETKLTFKSEKCFFGNICWTSLLMWFLTLQTPWNDAFLPNIWLHDQCFFFLPFPSNKGWLNLPQSPLQSLSYLTVVASLGFLLFNMQHFNSPCVIHISTLPTQQHSHNRHIWHFTPVLLPFNVTCKISLKTRKHSLAGLWSRNK